MGDERDSLDDRDNRFGSPEQVSGLVGFLCAEEKSVYMGSCNFDQAASLAHSYKFIRKTAKRCLSPVLPLFAGFTRVHRVRRERQTHSGTWCVGDE